MLKRLLLIGCRPGVTAAAAAIGGNGPAVRYRRRRRIAAARDICDLRPRRPAGGRRAVDGIIHLGGVSTEQPFDPILAGNIVGAYNLFEAARHHGMPRIVFASSNHVVGFYRRDERLDASVLPRPDSLNGLSKAFSESLASFCFDKLGQEISLR